jgi:hypothetical protein
VTKGSATCTLRTTRDDQICPFKIMLIRLGRNEPLRTRSLKPTLLPHRGKSPWLRKGVLGCSGENLHQGRHEFKVD